MKIKDLKRFCEKYNDEDVVGFCEFSYSSEEFTKPVDVAIKPRLPKKTEFKHKECKRYEEIEFKGKIRKFCNLRDKFLNDHSWLSCEEFVSKDNNVEYCLKCDDCNWNYGCWGIRRRD